MKNFRLMLVMSLICLIVLSGCKKTDNPFFPKWKRQAIHNFNNLGIADEYTNFQYEYTTPMGVKVDSVVPVPDEFLGLVDEGLQEQITRLSGRTFFPLWSNFTQPSQYRILIIHPNVTYDQQTLEPSPPCVTEVNDRGAPCMYVRGIKTAGTVLGTDDLWTELDKVTPIVVAHQEAQGWTYRNWFKNSIHNESEHVRGWHNRQNDPTGVFYIYLGYNDIHPWPEWNPNALVETSRPEQVEIIHEVK